jgi:Mg-chelatase subunit ChlD
MSPQQVMNALRSLERRGALAHPDLKLLIQDKLQRAASAPRLQAARSLTAAGAIGDETTKQQLAKVAADRLRRIGRINRPTAIFVDKSGSMERALELGTHVAALACTIADEMRCVYAFDSVARAVRPKGEGLDLAAWAEAFGRLRADGQTSIGISFAALARAGQRVEQVVVITDGEENSGPFFVPALREYEQAMAVGVTVVVVLVNAQRGRNALEQSLASNGVEAATWVFDGDLYSLPNLIPFLVTPRRAVLCAQILETPLPTRADLDRLPPGFDPVTCELL